MLFHDQESPGLIYHVLTFEKRVVGNPAEERRQRKILKKKQRELEQISLFLFEDFLLAADSFSLDQISDQFPYQGFEENESAASRPDRKLVCRRARRVLSSG